MRANVQMCDKQCFEGDVSCMQRRDRKRRKMGLGEEEKKKIYY